MVAEVLPPTGLGLLLFSFILLLNHITQLTGILIARGADFSTILRIFMNLMPSILATTIPMAFLLGVLLAFGRLASDSEIVAFRASGVSAMQLLKPVVALSLLAGAVTFYVMAVALPAANQTFRELFYALLVSKARSGVKPRVFMDDFIPGLVLYVADVPAETGEWENVFIHDARDPKKPRVITAQTGRLRIDRAQQRVELDLRRGTSHVFSIEDTTSYQEQRFAQLISPLDFSTLFPKLPLAKGDREMTLSELQARIDELGALGRPREADPYAVEWHKKFAIAGACFVFGILGVGLSLGSRREARSAAFGLSIGVIFVYYVLIRLGEQAGDTHMVPPIVAMWGANSVLGLLALGLLALNQRQAAFDPLDPGQYLAWLPKLRHRKSTERADSGTKHAGRRPVVVLRLPPLRLPLPGILDRYIGRTFLGHLALVLLAFFSIFLLAHFMDIFDDIQQNHVKGAVVMHFYTFFSAAVIYLVMPVATLVAPLATFGILTRRNEITAMKAGGVSLYRTVLPVLMLGALASLMLFLFGEYLLPYTNKIADRDFNVIKGRPPQSSSLTERRWILGSDQRVYNYDYMTGSTARAARSEETALYGLSVFDLDVKGWALRDRIFAARARWAPLPGKEPAGYYELERGWRRSFGPKGTFKSFDLARTREIEPPAYFRQESPESDTMRYEELRAHIASLEARALDVTKLKVQLERKLAFPMVCLVMTLIGVPFAFVVGKKGALYGIGVSILIAIVYWGCLGIFEALGSNALLPALLAAWAPNVLFGAAGLYLMLTLET